MNTEPILYSEVQRFRQWWLLAILGVLPVLSAWAFVQQIIFGTPWGNNPTSDGWLLVIVVVFGIGLPALILSINLRTEVRPDGIHVRFWPLHLGWVHIQAESIQEFPAQTYRPVLDYGGWGIRWGLKGKVYNVSGNQGVMLTYKNGSHLLIGSQHVDELERAIATACGRS